MEGLLVLLRRARRAVLDALPGASCLLSCSQLNEIGREQMAGDEEVEQDTQPNVLTTEVVALEANKNAVLNCRLEPRRFAITMLEVLTFCRFSIINRRLPTTAKH